MDKGNVKVYIAYAHRDEAYARVISSCLRDAGFEPWSDQDLVPGDQWIEAIDTALDTAGCFLILFSPEFAESKFANYEVGVALGRAVDDKNFKLIPVLLGGDWTLVPARVRKRFAGIDARNMTPEELTNKLKTVLKLGLKSPAVALEAHA